MSLVYIGGATFVDDDPIAKTAEGHQVYAWVEFATAERAYYGLSLHETDYKSRKIDSIQVGVQTFSEPVGVASEFEEALDALERGAKYVFEEYPAVEINSEADYKRVLEAQGLEEDEGDWQGPGIYDFRDTPPSFIGTTEEYEIEQMKFWADSVLDYMFQGDEWKEALAELLEGYEYVVL
jgi:hypothetical protein